MLRILEKEVEWLQGEQRQLEAHLSRTETWGENLGKWRAIVQSADVRTEIKFNKKMFYGFVFRFQMRKNRRNLFSWSTCWRMTQPKEKKESALGGLCQGL